MKPVPNDDPFWSECMVHEIEQYLMPREEGMCLDFKKLLRENEAKDPFKVFKDVFELESLSLNNQRYICKKLEDKDYFRIERALSDPLYLTKLDRPTSLMAGKEELLVGLLDFYNSRATSFVSMFVASIFGIVTLSAIIQSMLQFFPGNDLNSWQVVLVTIPYVIFAGAGYYTLKNYSYYVGIAELIKAWGLETSYYVALNKIIVPIETNEKYRGIGLLAAIAKNHKQKSRDS